MVKLGHVVGRCLHQCLDVSRNSISDLLVALLVSFFIAVEGIKPERCACQLKRAQIELSQLPLAIKVMAGQSKLSSGDEKISQMNQKSAKGNASN